MKVLKFGGSSVGNPDAIRQVVSIVAKYRDPWVVVSAYAGVTDALIATANAAAAADPGWTDKYKALEKRHLAVIEELLPGEGANTVSEATASILNELNTVLSSIAILRELSPRTLDLVMSAGERLSSIVVAACFREKGIPATAVDARAVIIADGSYGDARPIFDDTDKALEKWKLKRILERDESIPVFTGFIASTREGDTITLGRGGSDYTAAILGAALSAEEIEIWTDVNGILTADPRKVRESFSLDSLSYEEAMELSHFGAKVIYPPTIQPALAKGITIRIKNTFQPDFPGTVIASGVPSSRYPVRGISSVSQVSLLNLKGSGMIGVPGVAMRLFACLARKKINIILITQASSEHSICFAVTPKDTDPALAAVEEEFAPEIASGRIVMPVAERDKAILAVVGERMKSTPGISGRLFHALGRNGVNIFAIAQGSSELNISAVVDAKDEMKALNSVHEAFFLSGTRSVNVFLIGPGLIGGTLLEQIRKQKKVLSEEYSVRVNIAGLANSRKMLFREKGIDLDGWRAELEAEGEAMDIDAFVDRARALNLPNAAFVDCTTSENLPRAYAGFLKSSIAVVTPNKRGNSGKMDFYRSLRDIVVETGVPYLYETTVGAGLPVISTLHDLLVSGDRIVSIQAMLSGTIGYVFSNYKGGKSFASLVREAKNLGYTEPDPRDDLSAADAARKALILAREYGHEYEFSDISIQPILPESCLKAESVEEFFARLAEEEKYFRKMRDGAETRGKSLAYVATIDAGGLRLELKETGYGEPTHGLRDAENVVAFTTERYSSLPLTVRGPGAGAQVTAGGLFADIVSIAKALV